VLIAFLNKKYASFNLYYLIPFIYVIHIFPFHFLNSIKESIYQDDWKEKVDSFLNSIIIISQYTDLQKALEDNCFANPFGAQGMLIFGAITSAYALKK
jgi:hypothetical protein